MQIITSLIHPRTQKVEKLKNSFLQYNCQDREIDLKVWRGRGGIGVKNDHTKILVWSKKPKLILLKLQQNWHRLSETS